MLFRSGSGPGEIWSGPDEIKVAYEHFFEGFDKGEQKFEYQFRIGGVTPEMGWLMASGNVTGKKEGKEFAFPLNISLTAVFARVPLFTLSELREGDRHPKVNTPLGCDW